MKIAKRIWRPRYQWFKTKWYRDELRGMSDQARAISEPIMRRMFAEWYEANVVHGIPIDPSKLTFRSGPTHVAPLK